MATQPIAKTIPPLKKRVLVSIGVGLLVALICYARLLYGNCAGGECQGGDFTWSLRGAAQLLAGTNPYHDPTLGPEYPYPNNDPLFYPMPALMIAFPFVPFPRELGGALFFGCSTGILAFGLFRDGFHRWPLFLSSSFWFTLIAVQWSPLVLATMFLSPLLPLALAKPNIGLTVFLSYLKVENIIPTIKNRAETRQSLPAMLSTIYPAWRAVIASVLVLLLSLLLLPTWLRDWLDNASIHSVFVPMLVFPGVALIIALLRWRRQEARLLLLLALVPQRPIYDQLLLWAIPQTTRQMLVLSSISWITIFGWLFLPALNVQWIILGMYLPSLVLLFIQPQSVPKSA